MSCPGQLILQRLYEKRGYDIIKQEGPGLCLDYKRQGYKKE